MPRRTGLVRALTRAGHGWILAANVLFAGCASTGPRMPEEIRDAEALLRQEIPSKVSLGDAMLRAERLGFSCYWGGHAFIDLLPGFLLYCPLSCDASVKNGWWIRLSKDASDELIIIGLHGDIFAPQDPRRCAVKETG